VKTLIVFDSVFGCTEAIARAMGDVFSRHGHCDVVQAGHMAAHYLEEVDLIVVGSPTRAFRPTPALVRVLRNLPPKSLTGFEAVAFDTRMDVSKAPGILRFMAGIFGYAAAPIARQLRRKGARLVLPPQGFIVGGTEGPVCDGEAQRARELAEKLSAPRA